MIETKTADNTCNLYRTTMTTQRRLCVATTVSQKLLRVVCCASECIRVTGRLPILIVEHYPGPAGFFVVLMPSLYVHNTHFIVTLCSNTHIFKFENGRYLPIAIAFYSTVQYQSIFLRSKALRLTYNEDYTRVGVKKGNDPKFSLDILIF